MGFAADIKDLITNVLSLTRDETHIKSDIKEIRADIQKLTLALQQLHHTIERVDQREDSERRILKLELENQLLRQQRLIESKIEPSGLPKSPEPEE